MMRKLSILSSIIVFLVVLSRFALSQPQPSMYTLDNVYYYLTEGTEVSWGEHSLLPQSGIPGQNILGFTKSMEDIYQALQEAFTTCNGVGAANVETGLSFFSTQTANWGVHTGTLTQYPPTPDTWNGACIWKEGDIASCPSGYPNRHTRSVCTSFGVSGGGCTMSYMCYYKDQPWQYHSCSGQGCSGSAGGNWPWNIANQSGTGICTAATIYTYCCK